MSKKPKNIITILIADDHPSTRAGIRTILEKAPDIRILGEAGDGTDPGTTGCSAGAATVRQKWPYGNPGPVKVELRFSDACTTFWSRTWNFSGFWNYYFNATLKNWYWRQTTQFIPTKDTEVMGFKHAAIIDHRLLQDP